MSIRLKDYNLGFRIVSLALNTQAKEELYRAQQQFIYADLQNQVLMLMPESLALLPECNWLTEIYQYNSFDVFEIWENGLLVRRYNDKSSDNFFFLTNKCNSNCIMCPSSESSRKQPDYFSVENLIELAEHIPKDTPHLTITGGEPFLVGKQIFPFLKHLKERFIDTEFLFLTNGRVFSLDKYLELFCENAPCNSIVAIPIHGSNRHIHDYITQADGSFLQTIRGIKNLLRKGIPVEVRIVISKINVDDFTNLADLIITQFKGIEYVSVIAMEMTGAAWLNKEKVWIPYKESFERISPVIKYMVQNGIDTKLYNFPLCTVERPFWAMCEKSISGSKVRFVEQCNICRYKSACSGVFAGTMPLEKSELEPIL